MRKCLFAIPALALLFGTVALADDPVSGVSLLDQLAAFLKPLLLIAVDKFPVALTIIGVVGTARMIVKPIMVALRAYVDASPTAKDNKLLDDVEKSLPYRVGMFILDYLFSLKPLK